MANRWAIVGEPQDNSQATYAPILKKEDGHIDWSRPAREILNRIRGFQPWPGCYGFRGGQRLHIWKASHAEMALKPGELNGQGKRLFAGCGDGAIQILEVQAEGKKRMAAAAFLNGTTIETGETLQ